MLVTAGDLKDDLAGKGATRHSRHASLLDVGSNGAGDEGYAEAARNQDEDETQAEADARTPLMAALANTADAGAGSREGALARLRKLVRLPRSRAHADGTILDAERPQSTSGATARPLRRTKSVAAHEAVSDGPAAPDDAFAQVRERLAAGHGDLAPAGLEGAEKRLSLALSKMEWLAAEIERCQDALTETQSVIHAEELKVSRLRGVEEGMGLAHRREARESDEAEEIRRGIGELRRMLREVAASGK